MNNTKILIIGSNSFSGSHFVSEALQNSHEVWELVDQLNQIQFFFHIVGHRLILISLLQQMKIPLSLYLPKS